MNEEKLEQLKELQGMTFKTGSEVYYYQQKHQEFHNMIYELARFFLDKRLGGCPSCYVDAYVQLARLDLEKAKERCNRVFRLADGQLIYLNGNPISNVNLTNENAIEYLKAHPNETNRFDMLPTNLDELLRDEETVEEVKVEEPKVETPKPKRGRPIKRTKNKDSKD